MVVVVDSIGMQEPTLQDVVTSVTKLEGTVQELASNVRDTL